MDEEDDFPGVVNPGVVNGVVNPVEQDVVPDVDVEEEVVQKCRSW